MYFVLLRRNRIFEIIARFSNFLRSIRTILRYTKEKAEIRKTVAFEGGKYPGAQRASCLL